MKSANTAFWGPALINGFIFAVVLIIIQVVFWKVNFYPVGFKAYIPDLLNTLVVFPVVLISSGIIYRISSCGGYLSYGKAFLFGLMVLIFALFIFSIYYYLFLKFIDPGYLQRIIQLKMEWAQNNIPLIEGLDGEVIEDAFSKAQSRAEKVSIPVVSALTETLKRLFTGAVILTITSAIVKKESKNPFRDTM